MCPFLKQEEHFGALLNWDPLSCYSNGGRRPHRVYVWHWQHLATYLKQYTAYMAWEQWLKNTWHECKIELYVTGRAFTLSLCDSPSSAHKHICPTWHISSCLYHPLLYYFLILSCPVSPHCDQTLFHMLDFTSERAENLPSNSDPCWDHCHSPSFWLSDAQLISLPNCACGCFAKHTGDKRVVYGSTDTEWFICRCRGRKLRWRRRFNPVQYVLAALKWAENDITPQSAT